MKKNLKIISLLVVIALVSLTFFACNKDKNKKISSWLDIYVNTQSEAELTKSNYQMTLPAGWKVLVPVTKPAASATSTDSTITTTTANSDSDAGYIASIDAFVVSNGTHLSLIKVGATTQGGETDESKLLFNKNMGIVAIHVEGNLICVRTVEETGRVAVYNSSGRLLITKMATSGVSGTTMKTAVKILDSDLIAIRGDYDTESIKAGLTNYTSIYRASTGDLVCRIYNPSKDLKYVRGFDKKYVVVEGVNGSSPTASYMYRIPATAPSADSINMTATTNGTAEIISGVSDYYCEVTYIGGGRFLVHQDWTVTSTDDYTYYYNSEYMKVMRRIYNAESGKSETYNSPHYFLNLSNTYYGAERNGIVTSSFLKEGFLYSSYGIYVPENKKGEYDQYILDSDLNIILSLTGNFGKTDNKNQKVGSVGYFDLIMQYTDNVGITTLFPSSLKIFDKDGNIIKEITGKNISSASQRDGMVIAGQTDNDENTLIALFNNKGEQLTEFVYDAIEMFRGFYTVATRTVDNSKKYVLIGKDGTTYDLTSDRLPVLSDIATTGTTTKTPIFKRGCYVFKATEKDADGKDVVKYGIKNMNADTSKNLIMQANMTHCVLYSPSSNNSAVFVFSKFSATDNVSIFRLS